MLKLAICDDVAAEGNALKAHVERYAWENDLQAAIDVCSTVQDIRNALLHADEYDCLFLDIYMDELNGVEIARQLRKAGAKCRVVFFSSSRDHALEAFGVNAVQYLVKPVEYAELANALALVLEHRKELKTAIHIAVGNERVKIELNELVYAEAQQHYQCLHLKNGSVERTRMSSTELYELLADHPEFVRLGASFILNLKYVTRVSASDAWLHDGRRVPVPRRCGAEVKQKYTEFFMAGGAV